MKPRPVVAKAGQVFVIILSKPLIMLPNSSKEFRRAEHVPYTQRVLSHHSFKITVTTYSLFICIILNIESNNFRKSLFPQRPNLRGLLPSSSNNYSKASLNKKMKKYIYHISLGTLQYTKHLPKCLLHIQHPKNGSYY